jgi:ethanolamine permease
VYGVAIFMALMLAYYFGYSRHRLVAQAPEEEQALIRGAEAELR